MARYKIASDKCSARVAKLDCEKVRVVPHHLAHLITSAPAGGSNYDGTRISKATQFDRLTVWAKGGESNLKSGDVSWRAISRHIIVTKAEAGVR